MPTISKELALSGEMDHLVDYYNETLMSGNIKVGSGLTSFGFSQHLCQTTEEFFLILSNVL